MNKKKIVIALSLVVMSMATMMGCGAKTKSKSESADLVIIGAGGAGLAAAVQAKEEGVEKIVVLEKMPMVGGNTNKATGGMNAAESTPQKAAGIKDSIQTMIDDTMKGGKNLNDPELVKKLANEAKDGVDWLIGLGADLNEVARAGGATNDRIHRPVGGAAVGATIVKTLKTEAEKQGVDIRTLNEATEIVKDSEGNISGVKAKDKEGKAYTINTKVVVVAAGGFGANMEMITGYKAELEGFATTNHPGATGDGIKLVESLGGALRDMEQIQTHPTGVASQGLLISEGVRGDGAILVNKSAKRFYNELDTRDKVSKAVLGQEGKEAFLVFDDNVKDGLHAIEEYVGAGVVVEGNSVEDLASKIGVDGATLKATIDEYNTSVDTQNDPLGRTSLLKKLNKGKFYAIQITPIIHHTMGGVVINTNAEVLDSNGKAIKGLFAAGEVTGGVHGANRLGGNAVADIIVYGRQAGKSAAELIK